MKDFGQLKTKKKKQSSSFQKRKPLMIFLLYYLDLFQSQANVEYNVRNYSQQTVFQNNRK